MMERLAAKILALIDDVRYTYRDMDYLAWQIVQQSPRPMIKRVRYLAQAIIMHLEEMDNEDDTV